MKSRPLVLALAVCAVAALALVRLRGSAAPLAAALGGPATRAASESASPALLVPGDSATGRVSAGMPLPTEPPRSAYTGWSELRQPGLIAGIVRSSDGRPLEGAQCAL